MCTDTAGKESKGGGIGNGIEVKEEKASSPCDHHGSTSMRFFPSIHKLQNAKLVPTNKSSVCVLRDAVMVCSTDRLIMHMACLCNALTRRVSICPSQSQHPSSTDDCNCKQQSNSVCTRTRFWRDPTRLSTSRVADLLRSQKGVATLNTAPFFSFFSIFIIIRCTSFTTKDR